MNLPPGQSVTWVNDPAVALSPDGRRLVFVGGSGKEQKLYLRSLDELEARPIPGTEGVMSGFFSPDGAWIGFYAPGILKKVRLAGGLPITLCDASDPGGASWGPGNVILFAPGPGSGLWRVSAMGGSPSAVTTPDTTQGETSHVWPEILPDGKTAVFTILTGPTGIPRIGLLSLETGKYRVLVEEGSFARYVPTGHLLYMSEGVLRAAPFDRDRLEVTGDPVPVLDGVWSHPEYGTAHFTLSPDGTLAYVPRVAAETTLVSVDRAGAVRPILGDRRPYRTPRLSPDGRRLAITIDGHIWVYDMVRETLSRVTSGPDEDDWSIWTPDGNHLTYGRGDPSNLYRQAVDGTGEPERLTTSERTQRPTSWSPDGKTLVYEEGGTDGFDIRLLTLDGKPATRPFLQTPFMEVAGVLSPDGRFLAYCSDESGTFEVYVRPFPGPGGKWPISNEGGLQPVWARSGREILYRNYDKMMSVRVDLDPAFRPGKTRGAFRRRLPRT